MAALARERATSLGGAVGSSPGKLTADEVKGEMTDFLKDLDTYMEAPPAAKELLPLTPIEGIGEPVVNVVRGLESCWG
jgi:hypothetical protein